MKKMTKLLALLLVVVMVFSLAACKDSKSGNKDSKEKEEPVTIVGKYQGVMTPEMVKTINGADDDAEKMMMLMEGWKGMVFIFEFTEDNKYTLSVDKSSLDDMVEVMKKNMADHLAELNDMTEEELEAKLAEENMTREDVVDILLGDVSGEDVVDTDEMTSSGTYRLEDNKLYLISEDEDEEDVDNYMVIELTKDTLVLKELVKEDQDEEDTALNEKLLPWTFNRVK